MLRNLVPFYIWEDARVWAPWNHSFAVHFSHPGPVVCSFPSWVPSGCTVGGGCRGWWLDDCNILCLLIWQATVFHSQNQEVWIWILAGLCNSHVTVSKKKKLQPVPQHSHLWNWNHMACFVGSGDYSKITQQAVGVEFTLWPPYSWSIVYSVCVCVCVCVCVYTCVCSFWCRLPAPLLGETTASHNWVAYEF